MNKALLALGLCLMIVCLVSPVQAGWWEDFWGWMFGSNSQLGDYNYTISEVSYNGIPAKRIALNLTRDYNLSEIADLYSQNESAYLNLSLITYAGDGIVHLYEYQPVLKNISQGRYTCNCTILPENATRGALEICESCEIIVLEEQMEYIPLNMSNLSDMIIHKDAIFLEQFIPTKLSRMNGQWGYSAYSEVNLLGMNLPNMTWWNSSFSYRKGLNVTNPNVALSNFVVNISLNATSLYEAGKLNATCTDLRFTNSSDELLSYDVQTCVTNNNATLTQVLVQVPYFANGVNQLYMYYGNASAPSMESSLLSLYESNILAYWKFDNSSGSTAYDELGIRNFTLSDFTWNTSGIKNNSIYSINLTTNGFGNMGDISALSNNFTMNFWVYREADSPWGWTGLFSGSTYQSDIAVMYNQGSQYLRKYQFRGPGTINDVTLNFQLGSWYMITFVDNTTHQLVYINGTLNDTVASANTPSWASTFKLGSGHNDPPSQARLYGKFDEIGMWKRPLSTSELSQLAQGIQYSTTTFILGTEESQSTPSSVSVTSLSPENNTFSNNTTPTFSYNVTGSASTYICNLYIGSTLYGNNSTSSNASSSTILANSTIANGNQSWYVNCTTGSVSAVSSTRYLVIDTLPPRIGITSPLTNARINVSSVNVTVSVNESYLNYTNVSIINSTGSIINSSVNSTNSTATFYLNIYTDGNYSINATAFDLAGNSNRSVVSNITIDSQPPICVLVNRTPSKINDTSNGTFNVILNCSDYSGINTTLTGDHFWGFTSRTLDSFQVAVGVPNRWSIRPTPNNISQVGTNLTAYGPIFRAQGRGRSFWYESLSGSMAGSNLSSWFLYDNYSYAADDGHYGYFNLTLTNSTHAIINFTSPSVELSVFRQNIPLSYDSLVSESKKNFLITKNAGLLVQRNDLEAMKGSANYTIIVFRNIALQSSPIAALRAWYCNSTYSPTGGVTVIASPNCVLINTIPASAVIAGNIVLTDRNSSYYKGIYSISNNSIGGIVATPIHYYYYDTLENSPSKGYDFRYANGTTITNTSFAQTNRTWTTANDGASFTALAGTADLMEFTTKSTDDEFQFGYCIYDSYNHLGCNSTVFADQISPTNHPISVPAVIEYNSSGAVNNTNLSGYQMGTMNILIGCSKDPDSVGNVTHNLTLFTAAGAYNYTINSSFKCTNDSNTWINFNTSLVQDGLYKTNVSATSGDNPLDIQSFLTAQNFTIDNTAPAVSIVSPLNSTFTNLTLIDFSYTVTESNLNWTNVSIYNSTGDIINTTTNSSNGTVHSYLSVYTDGYYIFNVTACDLAGTCTQARGNFTRDATLPSVTINSPVSNSIVYSRMIDVNLSVTEAHLNLTNCTILNSTGSLLNSTTNSSNGSAQCYMTIYQDGNINISAIAYDLAGNMYSANVSNITVDTSLVIINFTLNSPSSGSFINSTTTVLNVTYYNTLAKDGNITFNISPGLSPNSSWCYQETANISTLCGGSALGNYSSSGFNSLGREAWDENWSSAASLNTSGFIGGTSGQIIINYSKPYGASNESLWQVKTSNGTANRTLPDSCWNAYLHVLSVRIDSKYNWDIGGSYINSSCYNGTSWVILDSLSTGFAEGLIYEEAMYWNTSLILWNVPSHGEASLLTTNLSSGQYTWSVLGTDSNSTNTSAIWNFTIDLTAPQVSISLPISNFATNLSPISISGNATDINLNYTNISLINSSGSIRNSTINTTNGTFTATLSAYSNGVYSINATAFDLAGNSNRSTVANITIDTVSPTISILSPLNNTWTNQTLIVFNYTVSDSYLNQTNVSVYNSSGALVNSSVNSSNGNAYAYISIYADGAYTFNVTACDTAGNCNQSRGNFTRDVTAPQVIINSPTTGENLDSRYVVINLTVNDLRLNYTNISLINSSGGIVNSTTSALTGNYEVTMLVPFNMILSINATSYDVAGNINQSTVTGVNASISVISTVLISPLNDSISNPLSVVLNLSYYNFDFLTGNASFYSVPIKDCYQESANVSNQSGMDGSCGLLYTGDYAIDGSWSNTSALYDGNWSTSGYSTDAGGFVYMYSNYTIPSLAVGAVLQGNVGAGNYNYTIPQACLEWSSKLTIISRSSNSSNTVRFSCATGPASSSGLVTISGTDQLNEEAIYWKVALGESDSLTYGDYANVTWPGLLTNTTYYWYVNITDGLNSYTSPTWQFTTDNAPSSPVVSLNLLAPMVNDTLTASGNSTDYEASNLTYYYRFYDETNSSFLTAWTTDPNLTLSDSGFAGHNITAYSIADDGVLNSSSGNASIIILNLSITLPVSGSNVFTHNINSSFNMTTGGNLSCTEMYNLTMYPRGNLTNGTHNYSTSVDFGNHTYTIFCISEQNSSRNFSRSAVGIVNSFGIWNVSLFNENNWTVPFNTSKVDNGVELIVICSSGSQYFYPNVSAVTTNLAIFCDVEWVEAKLEYNSSSYFRSVPAAGYGPFADIHLYLADAYIYTVLTVPIRILNSDYYNANITLYKEDIDPITSTSITYIITAGTFDVARIFPSYLLKDNRYLINITRGTETRDIGFLQPYTNGEQDLDIQEITLAPTQSVFSNAVQFGGSVNNSTGALIVTYQDSTQKTENITIVIYNNTGVYHNQTYVNSSNITLTMSGVDVNQSWYATYSLYHESYLPGQAIEGGTSLSAPLIFAITLPSYLYPLIAFLILFLEAAVITPKSITGGILFVGATLAMLFSASWIPVGVETMALSFMILAAGLILNMRNKGEAI